MHLGKVINECASILGCRFVDNGEILRRDVEVLEVLRGPSIVDIAQVLAFKDGSADFLMFFL